MPPVEPSVPPHESVRGPVHEPSVLQVWLLGMPRWQAGERSGTLSRIDAAWLTLVALGGPAREAPRDRLAAWLWPEVPLKTANTNLRQRLFKLRQATGHPVVEAGALWRLDPSVGVDRLASPPPPDGELLGGLDFGDLGALDAWLQGERESLRWVRADALSADAARLEATGALAAAIVCAERVLALAPTLEHAWRRLMRLHHLRGDRAAAVTAFERFEQQVCQELGLRPSDETLALLHRIEHGEGTAPPPRVQLAASLVRPPRLVGREAEWRTIQAAWHGGRAVLILGEGGLGKSRLLAELLAAERAATPARAVFEARARPGDSAMPYASITPLLQQAWAARAAGASSLAAGARRELARLLPELGEPSAAAAHQAVLWQAVEDLLAGQTATLALDDLHFADGASLELVRWLLASARLGGLRWLLAARPDEPEPATAQLQQWLGDSSRIEPIRLAALDADDIAQLLLSLGLAAIPDARAPDAAELHRHAGGHPFFTLETLKCLVLQTPYGGPMPLPASAAAMLQRRIDRLSPPARQLLRAFALAPGAIDAALAGSLLADGGGTLDTAWAELEAAQLARGGQAAHDLVREQVLAGWPAPARVGLATTLANALAAKPAERRLPAARLAQLWQTAQDAPQAARCLLAAAADAARAGRLTEQRTLLHRAAALWHEAASAGHDHDDATRAAVDAELLAAHATLLLDGSAAALSLAPALEARATTPQQRASLALLRANACLNEARFADALQAAAQALPAAPAGSPLAREAALLHARALALTGRAAEALAPLEAAATEATRCGHGVQALEALGALAHAQQIVGRFGDAVRSQQRATEAAQVVGDPVAMAQNLCNLATLQSLAGESHAAWHSAREADAQLARLGIGDAHRVYNRITWARCAAHLGRLDEALDALPGGPTLPSLQAQQALQAAVGGSMATMVQVIRHGVDVWLGTPQPQALPAPDGADGVALSPLARAGLLLAHLRAADATRRRGLIECLQQLADEHPSLRDDPVLAREWCRHGEPHDDARRLLQLETRCRDVGAAGLARSLALVRLDRLAEADPGAAPALADALWRELQQPGASLHPATHPPTAWATLARAFERCQDVRAAAARQQAERWLAEARLPPGCERARLCRDLATPA